MTLDREITYAEVALPLPLPWPCYYVVPPELCEAAQPGRLVLAPLGTQERVGCVVATFTDPPVENRSLRPILRAVTPGFQVDPPLIDLARWISDYYLCDLGETLAGVSFIGFTDVKEKTEGRVALNPAWREPGSGGEAEETILKSAPRRRLLEALRERGGAVEGDEPTSDVLGRARTTRAILKELIATGAAREWEEPIAWRPRGIAPASVDKPLCFTAKQRECFDSVAAALDERRFAPFLLEGVTGSGKTEIYLQAIQRCLDQGRQAICLVPEIALTPQTLERFQGRFGAAIGVCHGSMTRSEKLQLYHALRRREVNIVIGPRSAVFSPVPDLGLLVVDEEHEGTYKQDEAPRYNARDVGLVRARSAGAVVILGSATPSLESIANAKSGKYGHLTLPDRIDNRPLPPVEVVDMAAELRDAHNPTLFSNRLVAAIRERIERKEQVVLFLNRRGFANFVLCPQCGHLPRCPEDDVALTYHVYRDRTEVEGGSAPGGGAAGTEGAAGQAKSAGPSGSTGSRVAPGDAQGDLFEGLYSRDPTEHARARSLMGAVDPAKGKKGRKVAADRFTADQARAAGNVGPTYLAKNILTSNTKDEKDEKDPKDNGEKAPDYPEGPGAPEGAEGSGTDGPGAGVPAGDAAEAEAPGGDRPGSLENLSRNARLQCHFCGRKMPMPPRCPQCGDPRLSVVGQGTQRIEEELGEHFPSARVLRMDSDTMTNREAYEEAWRRISGGEVDIILGTQMIAKGLHLERVTLVGVILADVGLFVPDFRAAERTFALLTQVAGRTGRGALGGQVIVQTYVPQNAAVQCALTHDVGKFAEHEMKRRHWLRFPPVARLAALTIAGTHLDAVLEASSALVGVLRRLRHLEGHEGCVVLGPMPAPLSRLRGRWRQRILVRAAQPGPLHLLLRASLREYESRPHPRGVRIVVDIDPQDLM